MDDDRSMVLLAAVVGAALGGVAGYLFLTDRGRRLRQELVPQVEALVHDLRRLQEAYARARAMVVEGLGPEGTPAGQRQWNGRDEPAPF